MAAMAGLLNHPMTAGQAMTGTGANPMAAAPQAASGSAASSGSSSATISANDFLTLLVTEMQNQDPTAQTDPDEYINQLVQVNSLEQLIDINQNLTTALGDPGTTATGSASTSQAAGAHATPAQTAAAASSVTGVGAAGKAAQATAAAHKAAPPGATAAGRTTASTAHKAAGLPASVSPGSNTAAAISQFAKSAGAKHAPGNLSVPPAHGAAHKVAHALDGHSHTPRTPGKPAGAL
jgi:flagellar basal-body rod modification protein FlgD